MAPIDSPTARPRTVQRTITRRTALRMGAAAALLVPAASVLGASLPATDRITFPTSKQPDWRNYPFTLGVASGTPRSDGFVLWTRLAPDPLSAEPIGGMGQDDREIGYEIADTPGFQHIVQRGLARAEAVFAHSVHLEVTGLEPNRPYWYRFILGPWASPVGRAITAPAPGSTVSALRFGYCSCSNYEQGHFAAYRHLAEEEPDLVVFLGDYIYESVDRSSAAIRHHSDGKPATTLPL